MGKMPARQGLRGPFARNGAQDRDDAADYGLPLHTGFQWHPAEAARRRSALCLGSCQYKFWQTSDFPASPGLGKSARTPGSVGQGTGMVWPSSPRDTLSAVEERRER